MEPRTPGDDGSESDTLLKACARARSLCPFRKRLKISRMSMVSFLFPDMLPPSLFGPSVGGMPVMEESDQRLRGPVWPEQSGPLRVKPTGPV